MPKNLHFLFSTADQTNIQTDSFNTEMLGYSDSSDVSVASPLALKIEFRVINPALPVKIYPMFPGSVTFIASPDDNGIIPDPLSPDFDNTFSQWKKRGSLCITLSDRTIMDEMEQNMDPQKLPIYPTMLWIHGIELTQEFLFTTLKDQAGLEPGDIKGRPVIKKDNTNWYKHAISKFIEGKYLPEFKFSTESDTHYQYPLPKVVLDATGKASILIELAYYQKRTQDTTNYNSARIYDFFASSNYSNVAVTSARFEAYGKIPVDLAYRELVSQMEISMNSIWPLFLGRVKNYYLIRFTRTHSELANYSIYFSQQLVEIKDQGNNTLLNSPLPIPSHGILFLYNMNNVGDIILQLTGSMTWLAYSTDAWKTKGNKNDIPIIVEYQNEVQGAIPHILMRNTMTHEMKLDTSNQAPNGWTCTYISMRRFMRAFLNNRITGGRILQELKINKGSVKSFDDTYYRLSDVAKLLLEETCSITAANTFLPVQTDPTEGGKDLLPVFKKVFNDPASATSDVTQGFVAYWIWQSNYIEFNNSKSALFSDDYVGKGGPGAVVYLGLASYQIPVADLTRGASESPTDYTNRNARALLTGIEPGTILQYWYYLDFFSLIQDRTKRTEDQFNSDSRHSIVGGHSPVFWEIIPGNVFNGARGIYIMDQGGKEGINLEMASSKLRIGNRPVWIGSKWLE